jgi:hypothetical protein
MVTEDVTEFGDVLARASVGNEVEVAKECAARLSDGQCAAFVVPDFDAAVAAYQDGSGSVEEMALGSGKYASLWNREKLSRVLDMAGLQRLGGIEREGEMLRAVVRRFALPIPRLPMSDVQAIMSLPRVAWTDTMAATHLSCAKLGIDFLKSTGVFWGQCLERIMEEVCDQPKRKYVLTIDFDSIFDERDIVRLWQIMETRPDVDALFPLQIGRDRNNVLLTMLDSDGKRRTQIDSREFHTDAIECETGHMGLTLIRTDALRRMPKPWFHSAPDAENRWGPAKVDDDIWFWKRFREAGNKVCASPRVRIGHLQLTVTWPGEHLEVVNQWSGDYTKHGRPERCKTY